jgi:hypothetical protein
MASAKCGGVRILIKLLLVGNGYSHYLLSTSLSKMCVLNFLLDGCRIFPEACVVTLSYMALPAVQFNKCNKTLPAMTYSCC